MGRVLLLITLLFCEVTMRRQLFALENLGYGGACGVEWKKVGAVHSGSGSVSGASFWDTSLSRRED